MKILVVGCGKVGSNIAEVLANEKHNVVLVDSNEKVVQSLSNSLDALGVIGDAASLNTLKDAGVEDAKVLLAVTSSDEVNMLCCLFARKANPKIRTIARVRNPIYAEEIKYIKDELGLTLIINPEMAAAKEINKILRFPGAMKVENFSRDRVELVTFVVPENNTLVNKKIEDISPLYKTSILFVGIERENEIIIPHGDTVIKENDRVSIISKTTDVASFFSYIGLLLNPVKSVLIIGGSNIAYYLAKSLEAHKISVKIIDINKNRCDELIDMLPNTTIINADASDHNVLIEEGLNEVDAFVTLTDVDEENIVLSLFAANNSKAKVITKVNRISFDSVTNHLNVGSIIYPKHITADNIITYVRGLDASSDRANVTTLYRIFNNRAEAATFKINGETSFTGKKIKDIKFTNNVLICSIIRDDKVITPNGNDTVEVGDIVLIVTTNLGINDIEAIVK